MRNIRFALALAAFTFAAPAFAEDAPGASAPSKQAVCGAVWKANKVTLAPVHGTWPRFWSACNTALKTGADPLKAPAAPAKAKATPANVAALACSTDSDCMRRFGGNGDPAPAAAK